MCIYSNSRLKGLPCQQSPLLWSPWQKARGIFHNYKHKYVYSEQKFKIKWLFSWLEKVYVPVKSLSVHGLSHQVLRNESHWSTQLSCKTTQIHIELPSDQNWVFLYWWGRTQLTGFHCDVSSSLFGLPLPFPRGMDDKQLCIHMHIHIGGALMVQNKYLQLHWTRASTSSSTVGRIKFAGGADPV